MGQLKRFRTAEELNQPSSGRPRQEGIGGQAGAPGRAPAFGAGNGFGTPLCR